MAEGGVLGAWVIDEQPAMRRVVILAKIELVKLVFIGFDASDWFYRVSFLSYKSRICQGNEEMPIGL